MNNGTLSPSTLEWIATSLFALAVLHTFLVNRFQIMANRHPEGSIGESFFHLLGEIEVVFGVWAGLLLLAMTLLLGADEPIRYTASLNFTEPMFVFTIMAVAATRPVIQLARSGIFFAAKALPLPSEAAIYFSCLVIGPLLGSLITEPAAMTLTALILKRRFFDQPVSDRFKYATLAVLFVNISIGGVLTPYAAPPVLMVAGKWGWGLSQMLSMFGWKAAIAVVLNATFVTVFLMRELRSLAEDSKTREPSQVPLWLTFLHLAILALIVLSAHHPVIFIGAFMFFLGVTSITREFQDELKIRESLLVAFFLAGLVVLGGLQSWWLTPLIRSLDTLPLFLGSTALTAITDNAALTYLGSQVEGISDSFKYALVAGAVAGGGLTVIANAPNPAGYSILQSCFGVDGIQPLRLLVAALIPTFVAMACLGFL